MENKLHIVLLLTNYFCIAFIFNAKEYSNISIVINLTYINKISVNIRPISDENLSITFDQEGFLTWSHRQTSIYKYTYIYDIDAVHGAWWKYFHHVHGAENILIVSFMVLLRNNTKHRTLSQMFIPDICVPCTLIQYIVHTQYTYILLHTYAYN